MRYSIHDGPGIRTVVFLKGCPLTCWWCHNPEGQDAAREIVFFQSKCQRCGRCLAVCPHQAICPETFRTLRDRCVVCGACVDACRAGARGSAGRTITVSELLAEIKRDTIFYDESGGGVTFSGGEPLVQAVFLKEALAGCKALRIHTAVDTCGYAPRETLLSVCDYVDLFLFDLKVMDDGRHQRYTGVSNALILENLRLLDDLGRDIAIRVPLIPGLNDDEENLRKTAEFVSSLKRVPCVHLLPYHEIGVDKHARLGKAYLVDAKPPEESHIEASRGVLADYGLVCHIGG